jgi:hypothetical protein
MDVPAVRLVHVAHRVVGQPGHHDGIGAEMEQLEELLFRLAQLLFGLLADADVLYGAVEEGGVAVRIGLERGVDDGVEGRPVAAQQLTFHAHALRGFPQHVQQALALCRVGVEGQRAVFVQAQQLLAGGVAQHARQGRVGVEQAAVVPGAEDADGGVAEDGAVLLLAGLQGFFRGLHLGHVHGDGQDGLFAAKGHRNRREDDVSVRSVATQDAGCHVVQAALVADRAAEGRCLFGRRARKAQGIAAPRLFPVHALRSQEGPVHIKVGPVGHAVDDDGVRGVLENGAEAPLALQRGLTVLLEVVDVHVQPDDARWAAAGVPCHGLALAQHPAPFPVGMAHAEFRLVVAPAAGCHIRLEPGGRARKVVRVRQAGPPFVGVGGGVGLPPQHGVPFRAVVDGPGLRLIVPDARVGRPQHQGQAGGLFIGLAAGMVEGCHLFAQPAPQHPGDQGKPGHHHCRCHGRHAQQTALVGAEQAPGVQTYPACPGAFHFLGWNGGICLQQCAAQQGIFPADGETEGVGEVCHPHHLQVGQLFTVDVMGRHCQVFHHGVHHAEGHVAQPGLHVGYCHDLDAAIPRALAYICLADVALDHGHAAADVVVKLPVSRFVAPSDDGGGHVAVWRRELGVAFALGGTHDDGHHGGFAAFQHPELRGPVGGGDGRQARAHPLLDEVEDVGGKPAEFPVRRKELERRKVPVETEGQLVRIGGQPGLFLFRQQGLGRGGGGMQQAQRGDREQQRGRQHATLAGVAVGPGGGRDMTGAEHL